MVTAKKLMRQGMNREAVVKHFELEGEALSKVWMRPIFVEKMMAYLFSLHNKPA
jgi:hypothetical protein